MGISTEGRRTTTTDRLTVILLFLLIAACAAGRGPAQGSPPGGSPPSPSSIPGQGASPRFPRSADAVHQLTLRQGRLGWGGLEEGMTFQQAERALGRRLPALGSASQDELCGYYHLEAELMGQPLRLEFSAEAGESRLQAIWLPLTSRAGKPSREAIIEALHARFPEIEYVPSQFAPDLPEAENPRPLYRTVTGGGMIFVQPEMGGIYFGQICVD
jgi:hypothetical protein